MRLNYLRYLRLIYKLYKHNFLIQVFYIQISESRIVLTDSAAVRESHWPPLLPQLKKSISKQVLGRCDSKCRKNLDMPRYATMLRYFKLTYNARFC